MNNNEWQPIETAPKDGTWLLGLDAESKESGIIRWSSKEDYIKRSKEEGTANWKYNAHEGWQCYEYDSAYDSPTHWLALPKLPTYENQQSNS